MNYDSFDERPGRTQRMRGIVPHERADVDFYEPPRSGDGYAEPGEDGFNFWEVLRILLRRKWMILTITLLGVTAAALMTLNVTPLYRANATIEIQREEAKILSSASVDPVVVADAEYMATQYELLQSRSLAERVAEVLDLPSDPRYADQSLNREVRLKAAAGNLVNNIRVSPEGRSRVINVQFISPHKEETARIANAIVENFIESNLERKYNTTAYARKFIEERLATAKAALEDSERKLVDYAEQKNILEIGGENGSKSLDVDSLVSLNSELATAESERIAAEQRYLEARDGTTTQMLESDDLRRLRERRSDLNAEYQQKLGIFKPSYPDMEQLQARIDAIDSEIETEKANIVAALAAEFRAAQSREASLRGRVGELKNDVQDLRNRKIEYTILEREVDTNRSQYEALLQRMKEVSIATGVGSSQVSIVDRALVPSFPFEPNLPRSLIQAFILSLAAGIGLAFMLNYIDDTIKTPDDVRTKLGLPTIGVVPKVKGNKDIVSHELKNPKSGVSEAFFSARTALQFTTPAGSPKSLLLTSTRPSEGKTSSTVALGMAFAKLGQSVLIIDADMRKPSFVADAGASIGLSGLLTREAQLAENVVSSRTEGLFLLPAGIVPPNPAELLSSPRLKSLIAEAEELFDIVLIDSPPVLSFADAPLLGSIAEAAVVVIQSGHIRTPAVARTVSRMLESNTHVIGALLTKFDIKQAGYDYGYYSYAYGSTTYSYMERQVSDNASSRRKIRIFEEPSDRHDDTISDA